MNSLSLIRTDLMDRQTLGRLYVLGENGQVLFQCVTLELPWRDNERNISCIPPGRYRVRPRTSKKYGRHLHLLDVPGRDWILIHEANFYHQLRGCIAVGEEIREINGDGVPDITHSVRAKNRILKYINQETEIVIS